MLYNIVLSEDAQLIPRIAKSDRPVDHIIEETVTSLDFIFVDLCDVCVASFRSFWNAKADSLGEATIKFHLSASV
jgi:hypothetical protein